MGFSGATVADQEDRFGTFDIAALGQFVDLRGRYLRRFTEVETPPASSCEAGGRP
jgi:hypothetical protein